MWIVLYYQKLIVGLFTNMKNMISKVINFGRKEWFLIVMVSIITLVIALYELL